MKNSFILVAFDPKTKDTPIYFGYGLFILALNKDNTYNIVGTRENTNLGHKHVCHMPSSFIDWGKVENIVGTFISLTTHINIICLN
jgi:hypothetical protein